MIKTTLKKVFQLIFILMIAYAGSFVLMEETSEKTEKTEKSEEALHSIYHSKKFGKTFAKYFGTLEETRPENKDFFIAGCPTVLASSDFNINFIYYTSYLDYLS